MLDVAKELKSRKARKVFVCATFGLFTNGLQKFDEYYENGLIDRVLTTNLVYQTPELLLQTVLYQRRYEQIHRAHHR